MAPDRPADRGGDIAIIGMAGRFPGASDVDTFWRNLADGVESITRFSEEELLANGVDAEDLADPNYVPARPVLEDTRGFDATLFGYSPRDATVADPQQRIFLECAWTALEQGGYPVPEGRGRVGVFAGANFSSYMQYRFDQFQRDMDVNVYELVMGNDKDSLATMTSYKLDLTGPSVSVQTFCSTALVGVHLACRSLQYGECELALAGGVSLREPDRVGHVYQQGGMESPDGHVRTFDASARGSLFGDGAAVVLLKPLPQALADRDSVLAVIRGSAINNDGAMKFGYTAPSVVGQAKAVAEAMADAGVTAEDISYVEAHGTATELGDPMEVAALTRAFGPTTRKQFCAIGSVKTNVGHLDRAAGTTGLIKVVQSLRHDQLPRTLHYTEPNPEIDFADSPFYVNTELTPWPRNPARPRIAGINSLGMGGTNVHVVVQEPPRPPVVPPSPRRCHVLPVSARSAQAADAYCESLAGHLDAHPDLALSDVAYTLQVGRKVFEHRRVVTADSSESAALALRGAAPGGGCRLQRTDATQGRPAAFLLAGVGEHHQGMVARLYATEPALRAAVDECLELLDEPLATRVRTLLVEPDEANADRAADLARVLGRATDAPAEGGDPIQRTEVAQPAVFVAEYATAVLLRHWGIQPRVMLGYSLGEYVSACLAGVLSLPDALRLVAYRAELIADLPPGGMLAVTMAEDDLTNWLSDVDERGLDVAVTTGSQIVIAGPNDALDTLTDELRGKEIPCRRLDTTHAFHSRMLRPAADELTRWVAKTITLHPPQQPYISNVTGRIATREQVTDPAYWAEHMCGQVRFGDGLATALLDPDLAFVEIGAGRSLGALLRAHPACDRDRWPLVTATLPAAVDTEPADTLLATELAKLWLAGVDIDWSSYHGIPEEAGADQPRPGPGRIPLPTYPFQHQDYWLERHATSARPTVDDDDPMTATARLPRLPETEWLSLPVWRQTATPAALAEPPRQWLVYTGGGSADTITAALCGWLSGTEATVTTVRPGDRLVEDDTGWTIRPGDVDDTRAMLDALRQRGRLPDRVVHLWTLAGQAPAGDDIGDVSDVVRTGLHTLVALAQAAGELGLEALTLDIVTAGSQQVLGTTSVVPARATLLGACRLIPVEYPKAAVRLVDLEHDGGTDADMAVLRAELLAAPADRLVGLRSGRRWVPGYDVLHTPESTHDGETGGPIRPGGTYLVTGGLGGVGLGLAQRLAKDFQARLVLFGRTPVPPREQWDAIRNRDNTPEEVRRRLTGLCDLEVSGAEVAVIAGDVANPQDIRRAVDVAVDRFGGLDGVLHAAGVPGVGLIQFKSSADIERVLSPKVAGTVALATALHGVPVDFVVLFSSITSALGGGAGQLDYCSANAFLDAYAQAGDSSGPRTVAVNWGEWTWNGWKEGLEGYDPVLREFFEDNRRRFGISFDEGWRALLKVLDSGERQVVVSTQDFQTMVDVSSRYTVEDLQSASAQRRSGGVGHPRPDLATPFVAAQTDAERAIADIWATALGLAEVGIADNFFELGGNSLIGVDIIARVRRALKLDQLPPHILYETPTVGALAAAATGNGDGQQDTTAPHALERQRRIEMRRTSLRRGGSA